MGRSRAPKLDVWTLEQKRAMNEIFQIEEKRSRRPVSNWNARRLQVPEEQRVLLRADPDAGEARIQGQWMALQHQLGRKPCDFRSSVPYYMVDESNRPAVSRGESSGESCIFEFERWSRPQAEWASTHLPKWDYQSLQEDYKEFTEPVSTESFVPKPRNADEAEFQQKSLKKALLGVVPGKDAMVYNALTEVLKTGIWNSGVEETLDRFREAILYPHQVTVVLKQLKNVDVALRFFLWASSISGFKHDAVSYSAMITMLGNNGNWTVAEELFKEMVKSCSELDAFAINSMIKAYLMSNMINRALELYRHMPTLYRCEPDNWTFSLLIDWLGKFGNRDQLQRVYMDLMQSPQKASSNTFNTLIYNMGRLGDIYNVREAVKQMKKWGIALSSATYGILIHTNARLQNFMDAYQVYSDYLASGLPPDMTVFNNAVWCFGLAGRLRDAEDVIGHIEKAGLAPDKFTYCSIISGCSREGNMEQAKGWFDRAIARGVTPSAEMYNALLDGFLRAGMVTSAEELMSGMAAPTLQTYTFLLKHYATSKRLDARTIMRLMEQTKLPVHDFFSTVISKDCPSLAHTSEAFFEAAREERPRWALKFANTLLNFLHSSGYTKEAYRVFEGALCTKLFARGILEELDGCWYLWLLDMEVGTALVALNKGLNMCKQKLGEGLGPSKVFIITGYNRPTSKEVTRAVDASLDWLRSPFEQNIKLGRFMCEAHLFKEWMDEPQVVREVGFL